MWIVIETRRAIVRTWNGRRWNDWVGSQALSAVGDILLLQKKESRKIKIIFYFAGQNSHRFWSWLWVWTLSIEDQHQHQYVVASVPFFLFCSCDAVNEPNSSTSHVERLSWSIHCDHVASPSHRMGSATRRKLTTWCYQCVESESKSYTMITTNTTQHNTVRHILPSKRLLWHHNSRR